MGKLRPTRIVVRVETKLVLKLKNVVENMGVKIKCYEARSS